MKRFRCLCGFFVLVVFVGGLAAVRGNSGVSAEVDDPALSDPFPAADEYDWEEAAGDPADEYGWEKYANDPVVESITAEVNGTPEPEGEGEPEEYWPVVESVTAEVSGTGAARTVRVTFTFSEPNGDACHVALFGHCMDTLAYYPMVHFAEGDIYDETFAPGTHTLTWLPAEDSATPIQVANFKVYAQVSNSGRIAPGEYLVIDVSGGPSAASYPVSYHGYVDVSLDVYKTTMIVLRQLPDGSWMGVYEVTQRQYELVTGQTPSYFSGNPMRPVERVSWNDITGSGAYSTGFIARLRSKAGVPTLNLPSSAAWEYACRAGSIHDFNDYTQNRGQGASDEAALRRLGWYYSNSGSRTHDSGGKQPNAWGLYDMHGNVWEWTATYYSGTYRVIRGGCWYDSAGSCRSGHVHNYAPDARGSDRGFRLAVPAVR